jgi:hypothetical protein
MKVKYPIPNSEQQPVEAPSGIYKATPQIAHPRLDIRDNTQSTPKNPQSFGDASTPAFERLDVDLAFERDELLQIDPPTFSHRLKVWKVKGLNLKLSALEGTVPVKRGVFTYDDFEL